MDPVEATYQVTLHLHRSGLVSWRAGLVSGGGKYRPEAYGYGYAPLVRPTLRALHVAATEATRTLLSALQERRRG